MISKNAGYEVVSYSWFYSRAKVVALLLFLTAASGITYLAVQWDKTGTASDWPFVALLIGATAFLLLGMRLIHKDIERRIYGFYEFALGGGNPDGVRQHAEAYHRGIFRAGPMTISGIIYGLLVASALYLMEVWHDRALIKVLLFAFLFIVNFVTGIGFYGLIKFFFRLRMLAGYVKVDLWQRINPTTLFFMRIKRKAALLAIVYVSICVFSIFFSELQKEFLSQGYEVFAGILVILVFLIPELPLRKKVAEAKRRCLSVINAELDGEFCSAQNGSAVPVRTFDAGRVEKLMALREKVRRLSIWPFGLQTLRTAFSVVLVTLLPMILEYLLKTFIFR